VGDYVHQDSSEDEKHLFITARIQPGSQFLAEAIGHHSYGSLDAIYFPTDDADPTPAGKLTLPAWEGDHKLGIWMEADLKSFLDRTDVEKLSPIVVLKVKAADKVDDLLPCLSVLHAVAPRRFIVYIPQP
jgi:hypothetical protein